MILKYKNQIFKFSEIANFRPQTQKILAPFMANNNFPLQFYKSSLKYSFIHKFLQTKSVANKFKTIIKYIQQCSQKSIQQNKQLQDKIQINLKNKIQFHQKSKKQKIIVHQCEVQRLQWLQQTKIYGVFMHRQLNLPKQCYSREVTKNNQIKYRLKNNLTNQSHLRQVNPILKRYAENNFDKFYLVDYEYFQKNDYILRQVVRVRANLKVQIINQNDEDNSIRLGYNYPTEHILQFETIDGSYQRQNYLITDIDCFMSGNFYFQK